jgi:hypothetical protein
VIIRSELEFGCSWDSSFVFKIDWLSTRLSDSCFGEFED